MFGCFAASIALAGASGCGGKEAATPDAAPPDAAPPDASSDAPVVIGPSEITIRTFPEGFPYLGRTANAALVAFQDGDGAWQALTGTEGIYRATASGLRYGVAIGCTLSGFSNVWLYYQAVTDTKEVRANGCPSEAGRARISVDVLGIGEDERGEVWFGRDVGFVATGEPADIFVVKGVTDVFVKSYTSPGPKVPVRLYRGASLDLQADQTLSYDLATLGHPPEPHGLTVAGLDPSESVVVNSTYATPFSSIQWPVLSGQSSATPDATYVTLAAAARQPTDVSNVTVIASRTANDGRTFRRTVRRAMNPPVAVTVALPAAYPANPPVVDASALRRATVTIPIAASTLGIADYTVSLSTPPFNEFASRTWTLFVQSGWAGAASSVTIVTPDLSGLPGWSADMALRDAVVSWTIERGDHNLAFDALPVDGRHIVASSTEGELPAP